MTEIDLSKLRKIAEAATPGPWEAERFFWKRAVADNRYWLGIDGKGEVSGYIALIDDDSATEDAAHIATFDPPTVIALIDELERLREVVATVRSITDGTPICGRCGETPITCGWKFDLQRIKEVVECL